MSYMRIMLDRCIKFYYNHVIRGMIKRDKSAEPAGGHEGDGGGDEVMPVRCQYYSEIRSEGL